MTFPVLAAESLSTEIDWLPRLFDIRLGLPIVVLAALWVWETACPFFELPRHRGRHAIRNLSMAMINAAAIGLLFGTVTVAASSWVTKNGIGLLQFLARFPTGRFVAGLLFLDGWMYVWHRLNHRLPILWRFHRVHHSDPTMDVTTAARFHLGEHMISASLRLMLIPLVGLSISQIVVYEIAVVVMTHFHHANISVGKVDRWLRCLLVTPDMHKVHHSRWQPETDSNYAVVLSIWDRLARTFRLNNEPRSIKFGIEECPDERSQTIHGMLRTPFVCLQPSEETTLAGEEHNKGQPQS